MSRPVLKNEVITFPVGTIPEEVKRDFCGSCNFGVYCSKPKTEGVGATVIAENLGYFLNDEYIARNAKCDPDIEGHPIRER